MGSPHSRSPVLLTQALFLVNGAVWILFGIVSLIRGVGDARMAGIVVALMWANAGVLLLLGWGLGRQRKLFYYLAVVVLAVNTLLSVTDEFGLFDFLILALNAVLLALLIATRSRYLSTQYNGVETPEFSKER